MESLEEENRILRQRDLMRKMFALGDQARATATAWPLPSLCTSPTSPRPHHPRPPAASSQAEVAEQLGGKPGAAAPAAPAMPAPKMPELSIMRGFTSRELVTNDPFAGFSFNIHDMATFSMIEEAPRVPQKLAAAAEGGGRLSSCPIPNRPDPKLGRWRRSRRKSRREGS